MWQEVRLRASARAHAHNRTRWYEQDWVLENRQRRAAGWRTSSPTLCASDVAFIVMGSSTHSERLTTITNTWGGRLRHTSCVLYVSDRQNDTTNEFTTDALRGREGYWDAQARHFEGLRVLYRRSSPPREPLQFCAPPTQASLPKWTLLVDDDSYVNVGHLLTYASRFDPEEPVLIGHILDGVWSGSYGVSGGAGMLLSRSAVARFGHALQSRSMPLPPRGIANDAHIITWARRLSVQCVHSNLFWYSSLPADARIVSTVGHRVGYDIDDYVAPNTIEGMKRKASFASAAFIESNGALLAQVLGAVVVHRIPKQLMFAIHSAVTQHGRLAHVGEGSHCSLGILR